MNETYLTVVYKCTDAAAMESLWVSIRPLFMAETGNLTITGVAKDDQMTRLQMIEELAERRGEDSHETIGAILELIGAVDAQAWRAENASLFADDES